MAETAKILSPEKKVLLPDLNAGCSLAESCPYSGYYVNTSVNIKALSDITCTSTNAVNVINSIPKSQEIIFAPDRNLGNYLNSLTGRNMIIWDGACHVHEEFSLEKIIKLKEQHPSAKLIAHPECQKPILIAADFVGSTPALLRYTETDKGKTFIVATESGILHQMKKRNPQKIFIPTPPIDSTCGCNDCKYMKMINLENILKSLEEEQFEISIDPEVLKKARKPILKMLELSN